MAQFDSLKYYYLIGCLPNIGDLQIQEKMCNDWDNLHHQAQLAKNSLVEFFVYLNLNFVRRKQIEMFPNHLAGIQVAV